MKNEIIGEREYLYADNHNPLNPQGITGKGRNMTIFVHNGLKGETVKNFIRAAQEEYLTTLEWKNDPYVNNTKLRETSISHWPGKETLTLQGPEEATTRLNELFKLTMRDATTSKERSINNNEQESNTSYIMHQIEGLAKFISNWENPQRRIDRINGGGGQSTDQSWMSWTHSHPTNDEQGKGDSDEIRRFKQDIMQYMHTNNLIPTTNERKTRQRRHPR